MYFNAILEIDPSQITVFKKVKPTKLFGKLLDALSFGALTEKQEYETFTAISILQQINMGLRSINVKNVIRLSVDDYDFYLDEKGVDDDLEQAMFEFKAKVDPLESELFNTIYLVLEHEDEYLKYVVEIAVKRKHRIGEYPIQIHINGILKDFKIDENNFDREELKKNMAKIFSSQTEYDNYVNVRKTIFDQFVGGLAQSVKKFIRVDDIKIKTSTNILRPKEKIDSPNQIKHSKYNQPIHYGYYGIDDYLFYTTLWGSLMFSNSLMCHNCIIVDSLGNEVMEVGDQGFDAGEYNTLNDEASFEIPKEGDINYYDGNEYEDLVRDEGVLNTTSNTDEIQMEETSWLDNSDSFDDGGACSSCSSCSSCGGCT